ncbi:MAG TPA: HlyD family efflux transporter periplasmic adaptor subunit [Gemmatimonadales bacterium]|nr:HlyD family efflux transporter periplasmic adaptor subunit [Gemmatimonadales bacterium]
MPYLEPVDIPRAPVGNRKRYVQGGIAVGGVILLTILLASLKPAAPSVDREVLSLDGVRRGPMVREVRGPGTLVPEHIRWISALTPARVERIFVQPGTIVQAGTVLLELANPDVQIEALDAQRQLTAAQGELVNLRTSLQGQRLTQAGLVAITRSQYLQAKRDAAVADSLTVIGGLSRNDVSLAREKADELEARYDIEKQRLDLLTSAVDSQLEVQREQVVRLRAITAFRLSRLGSLQVRAGEEGVLQELTLQLGQWVVPGTILAKVVQPGKLKAVIRIPETQAPGLAIGQPASVDTRTGFVAGRVVRIDPAAQQGTVTVDIALDGALPDGARPDISVDATITIERLNDVLSTGRPAYGQPNSTIGMFKLVEGGRYAVRIPVKVGRTSVNAIEIVQGLAAGDSVILSDMSRYDNVERVRLK